MHLVNIFQDVENIQILPQTNLVILYECYMSLDNKMSKNNNKISE